jgi:hypothetical protein
LDFGPGGIGLEAWGRQEREDAVSHFYLDTGAGQGYGTAMRAMLGERADHVSCV